MVKIYNTADRWTSIRGLTILEETIDDRFGPVARRKTVRKSAYSDR